MQKYYKPSDLGINAVTATTTSNPIPVDKAEKATFVLKRASHTAGSSTFTIQGTIDGDNYIALNSFITDVTNTNVQNLTRVASVALSSNTSQIVSLDLKNLALKFVKVVATLATDGNASVSALVELED